MITCMVGMLTLPFLRGVVVYRVGSIISMHSTSMRARHRCTPLGIFLFVYLF